jgi:uncharacterized protein YjbI with pentapeptide repeats
LAGRTISQTINLSHAILYGKSIFSSADKKTIFLSDAYFGKTIFSDDVNFYNVEFRKEVSFNQSVFNSCEFIHATFFNKANFRACPRNRN